MNKRFFSSILVLVFTSLISISAQEEWVLEGYKSDIFSSLVDSITYTNEDGAYFENQWSKGEIANKVLIEEYDYYLPHPYKLEYSYCTLAEDGVDAVATDYGLYATLQFSPDSTNFALIVGNLNDDSEICLVFDSLGYAKTLKTSENEVYPIFYTSNKLLVFDAEGEIVGEISYTEFEKNKVSLNRKNIRKVYEFTQNPIYKGASILATILEIITAKKPIQEIAKQLLVFLVKGAGHREVDCWAGLLTAGVNPFGWIELMETADELLYFENTTLTAMDAIKKNCTTYVLPCKIKDFKTIDKLIGNLKQRVELLNYSYTLEMTARSESNNKKDIQSKKKDKGINNGVYNFDFVFKNLETKYKYVPSLTLLASYTIERLDASYISEEQMRLVEHGYTVEDKIPTRIDTIKVKCKILGNENSLYTGSVNSFVEYVENVKVSSADIVCSFSEVPAGAKCYVTIAEYGSDITVNYDASSDKSNQTIHVTGLAANTAYIANTVILYNGEMFVGENMVGFTTDKPEGKVISVDNETITMTTAIAKCEFKGIEAGTEVGVIVNPSSIGKFVATSKDGEQSVELTNLEPCTTYECFAYIKTANHYEEQTNHISFTTKGADLTGEWIGAIYDEDKSVLESIKLTLKENNEVVIESLGGESFVPETEVGSWRVYERDKASIHFGWGTGTWNPIYYGETFGGTLDDAYNPKKIVGTVYRARSGMTEHGNTYEFELRKK